MHASPGVYSIVTSAISNSIRAYAVLCTVTMLKYSRGQLVTANEHKLKREYTCTVDTKTGTMVSVHICVWGLGVKHMNMIMNRKVGRCLHVSRSHLVTLQVEHVQHRQ